jgi:hypothetical protein
VTPNAARQALWRRRQRDGRCCLIIEVDEVNLAEMLERFDLLPVGVEHSREELGQALQRQVELLAALGED